jgi:2-keto-4-pentenoate hydratase/2-oxohepta-3-ene-1,7-dioic acid hydratase in catechol pathway
VRLVAPVLPSKVVAIGRNYADHVKEMGGDEVPDVPSRSSSRRRR